MQVIHQTFRLSNSLLGNTGPFLMSTRLSGGFGLLTSIVREHLVP